MRNIRKVLTFRPASIGDCLLGKYFLQNIRAQYPDARTAIVVGSRGGMIRNLFLGEPWIEVIEANRNNPSSLVSLLKDFAGSDVVMTPYTSGTINISTKLTARTLALPGTLVGFEDKSLLNKFIYNILIPIPAGRATRLYECDALKALNIPVSVEKLSINHVPMNGVVEKFGIKSPYVIVHMFSGSKSRGLSTERMRALLGSLTEKLPGTMFVLSGGAGDLAEATEASVGFPSVVIAGKASLQELMNLMLKSSGVVSLDTGVGHIASHMHIPLIIITTCMGLNWWSKDQYGSSVASATFCREDLCKAGHQKKNFPNCMNEIDMEAVADRAKAVFV